MDVALAVGLQLAQPEQLRFFVASDSPKAVEDFTAGLEATLARDFPKLLARREDGSGVVFHAGGDQSTRGAALDMLLLGMTNETGETFWPGGVDIRVDQGCCMIATGRVHFQVARTLALDETTRANLSSLQPQPCLSVASPHSCSSVRGTHVASRRLWM